jgi:predicted transcriptional regulator
MSHSFESFVMPSPAPKRSAQTARQMECVRGLKAQLREELCRLIEQSIAAREWQSVIAIVIQEAGLNEADIARGLEMTRSTVNRWLSGQTEPPSVNMPKLGEKLVRLVREKLG